MASFNAMRKKPFMAVILLFLGLLYSPEQTGAQSLGICYGGCGNADNLPPESEAIRLCKTYKIGRMRFYCPYIEILQVIRDSKIELIVGVPNDKLQALANPSAAGDWVQNNIKECSSNVKFKYTAIGNEVNPTSETTQFVLRAMQNIYKATTDSSLQNQIKVSAAVETNLLGVFDTPLVGAFSDNARPFIEPIIGFLFSNGALLLANIYLYFRVKYNNQPIPYALFTKPGVGVPAGAL